MSAVRPPYIELHTASAFSFLQGASLPEALVERAAELGYPALALLDRDGVYGAPRFHKAALAAGITPIIGAELTIDNSGNSQFTIHNSQFVLPVLCESQEGYRNLCRLITRMKLRAPKGEGALTLDELDGSTRGLVALVGRAALDGQPVRRRRAARSRSSACSAAIGVYVELQRHFRRDEDADNQTLVELAAAFRVPVVATNGVRFATPAERPLFDVLTCIHHHTDLAQAGRRLAPNAERYLKPPDEMAALFADLPGRDRADAASSPIGCSYTMADLGYRFPDYPVPPGETQASFLRKITEVGARERYRPYHDRARAQIARELDLIEKLDLAGYFLIVWDIVNFCRQHDILVQGRGSAANSAVCYSLGITAVDPVGMDLLFERFLSEERGEWPDIDLDLPSGDRRERVIQHVYEKYGRLGAAMTANVITYRGRSAAREVGKALGFEPAQVDRLAKVMNNFEFIDPADTLPRHLAAVGLDLNSDRVRLFARLWGEMQDLPRHLGQHSGGMVICQGQLDAVVPLENASMPGRVVVQWDKDDCADMGIVKVDLLGLGMMAVHPGRAHAGQRRDGDDTTRDHATLGRRRSASAAAADRRSGASAAGRSGRLPACCSEADTIGVFQVESRAQMATLPRLKPALLLRPRRAGGDHPARADRRPDGASVSEPPRRARAGRVSASVARADSRAHARRAAVSGAAAADGDGGGRLHRRPGRRAAPRVRLQAIRAADEADRSAAARRHGAAGHHRRRGRSRSSRRSRRSRCTAFPSRTPPASRCSPTRARISRCTIPAAFYTALLNNQPMGFYHPSTLVKDAQRRGVRFHPIDVQVSDWDCTVEADGAHPARAALCQRLARAGRDERSRASPVRPPAASPAASPQLHAASCHASVPNAAATMNRCSSGCDARRVVLQQLLARLVSRAAERVRRDRPLHVARRSRRAHRPAPRRSWSRWPTSARSTRSATTADRRCGRPSARCGRRASCSTNVTTYTAAIDRARRA